MRIDVRKFLFVGHRDDKKLFFEKAQKFGIIEFKERKKDEKLPPSPRVEKYSRAIKILRGYVLQEQEIRRDMKLAERVLNEILEAKNKIDIASDELSKLEQEHALVEPFGMFSLELFAPIETATKRRANFYIAKSNKRFDDISNELILVNSVNGIDYFISFTEEPLKIQDLFLTHINRSHEKIMEDIEKQKAVVSENESTLKELTKYVWTMHFALVHEMNNENLDKAAATPEGLFDNSLFFIEAWVPNNKIAELKTLFQEIHVYGKEIAIEKNDAVPTHLENKGLARVGEDIIQVFDVPSSRDKDPSLWVLSSFALFFAMIVGDAGYGLVFLFTALMMHLKSENSKGFAKRFIVLIAVLGSSCFAWGILTDSFFGVPFSPHNPLHKMSAMNWLINKKASYHILKQDAVWHEWVKKIPQIKTATTGKEFIQIGEDSSTMDKPRADFEHSIGLELALLIGAIHVSLGLARYLIKKPVGAGWIAFIIGSYLYLPSYLHATSILNFAVGLDPIKAADFGMQLLIGGVIFSTLTAISLKGFVGIFEIMEAIQIFSDVLSYLRIFALALAGAIISSLINQMSDTLPTFVAIVMSIFGHALNIVIAIAGGVIHGLRLNFLEWYRYSFEGGGKSFKPLELHVHE